jgi:outer membrane biosynthesis protein TonB
MDEVSSDSETVEQPCNDGPPEKKQKKQQQHINTGPSQVSAGTPSNTFSSSISFYRALYQPSRRDSHCGITVTVPGCPV